MSIYKVFIYTVRLWSSDYSDYTNYSLDNRICLVSYFG